MPFRRDGEISGRLLNTTPGMGVKLRRFKEDKFGLKLLESRVYKRVGLVRRSLWTFYLSDSRHSCCID